MTMSNDDFLADVSNHARLLRAGSGLSKITAEEVASLLTKSIGSEHASLMLRDRNCAESYLTSTEAKLRCAALLALTYHWEPDNAFKDACERLVLGDPNPIVRKCALASFYVSYYATDRLRVGRAAAALTYDNSLPLELRLHAYRSIVQLYMHGRTTAWYPKSPDSREFRFPEDVDWKLVDSFMFA